MRITKLLIKISIALVLIAIILYYLKPNRSVVVQNIVEKVMPTATQTFLPVIGRVPFTSQSPFGDWKDPRQQDGCEEASALMAMRWVKGRDLTKNEALAEILDIADYEEKNFGNYHDTNAHDTVERIFKGYYQYGGAVAVSNISVENIKTELAKGQLVLVPLNGQKLGNPNFSGDGPDRHMLVIMAYDAAKDEFITNDPGTRKGAGYRYKSAVIQRSLNDYPTGDHLPMTETKTAMIIVQR